MPMFNLNAVKKEHLELLGSLEFNVLQIQVMSYLIITIN